MIWPLNRLQKIALTKQQFQQAFKMIVKKVFQVSSKKIQQKAPYVKPKYKTYRQLLDLDRPRTIVLQSSDDEHDDFLEKLMKVQEKKEKQQNKRKSQKSSTVRLSRVSGQSQASGKQNKSNQNQTISLNNSEKNKLPQTLKVQKNRILSSKSSKKQLNDSMQYLTKKHQTQQIIVEEADLNQKIQDNSIRQNKTPFFHDNRQHLQCQDRATRLSTPMSFLSPIKVKKRNSSETNLNNLQMMTTGKIISEIEQKKTIFVDQASYQFLKLSQGQNKIIQNHFYSTGKLKKSNGFVQLKKITHQGKYAQESKRENPIESKINPEKKAIFHTLSKKKQKQQNRALSSQKMRKLLIKNSSVDPIQMILMKQALQNKKVPVVTLHDRLFKNNYQQQLFLKSLKKPLLFKN